MTTATVAEGPSGAQTYEVDVDAAASPEYMVATYFPAKLTVRPGDTIVFNNKSKAWPHTVTLGIKADQSNRPPTVTDKGENPAAFGPCFTDTEPSAAADGVSHAVESGVTTRLRRQGFLELRAPQWVRVRPQRQAEDHTEAGRLHPGG